MEPSQLGEIVENIKTVNVASLSAMEARLDWKLAEMKVWLTDHQEVVQQVSKKAKLKNLMEFRSKGNEVQYKFNGAVVDAFKEVSAQLKKLEMAAAGELGTSSVAATKITSALQAAHEAVEEGEKHLETWQKHIRLSELEWMVVKEYERDELVANTADEKRMVDAEKAAAKGKKQKAIGKYTQPQSSGYRPAYQNLPGHTFQYSSPRRLYHPTAAATKPVPLFPLSSPIGPC